MEHLLHITGALDWNPLKYTSKNEVLVAVAQDGKLRDGGHGN
jgi:hypothetical protein